MLRKLIKSQHEIWKWSYLRGPLMNSIVSSKTKVLKHECQKHSERTTHLDLEQAHESLSLFPYLLLLLILATWLRYTIGINENDRKFLHKLSSYKVAESGIVIGMLLSWKVYVLEHVSVLFFLRKHLTHIYIPSKNTFLPF